MTERRIVSADTAHDAITELTRVNGRGPTLGELADALVVSKNYAGKLVRRIGASRKITSTCPGMVRHGRAQVPLTEDEWTGDFPEPNEDAAEVDPEWLWSRSVDYTRVDHEIRDPIARSVVDKHVWKTWPTHQPEGMRSILEAYSEMRAAKRKARPKGWRKS